LPKVLIDPLSFLGPHLMLLLGLIAKI